MSYKAFFKRLFSYLKPHLNKLILTSVIMVFATVLESSIPEITGQIVDKLFVAERSASNATYFSLGLLLVFTLAAFFILISTSISSWVSNKVIADIRKDMFEKIQYLPKSFFDNSTSGQIISKFTFDVEQIAAIASSIWIGLIKSALTVVILTIYLFYKSWELSLSLIVISPILFYAVTNTASKMRNSSDLVQSSMGDLTHLLKENIQGNSIIKIYGAMNYEVKKFFKVITSIRQQRFKVDVAGALNSNLINILVGFALAFVVYFSSLFLNLTGGEFLSYFTALAMIIKPAKTLIDINKPLQIAIAAGESVFHFLDEEIEKDNGIKKISTLKQGIEFRNISFSYTNTNTVLSNLSLNIKKGQKVAIVGPTGSGKSTIIELLFKFYNPVSGEILIDGINISEIDNSSLRNLISYVDQNNWISNDTIQNNITLGNTKISNKEIIEASIKSNSNSFIENLADQYNYRVGDEGKLLSGGQKQRLSIARAIVKDSPILVLDEATSALDSKTENLVQSAIDKVSKGKTTIIIAHRLSTVQSADLIIVLDKGMVIESGKHSELLKNNNYYSKLIESQFG